MKKSMITFCLLIISGILNAQYQVSQEQAVTAAINTIKYNGRTNITSSDIEEINTLHNGDTIFMYEVVFNTDDIVLLSGNITCSPILGYILHDNVETQSILDNYDNIPDGLKEMINEYLEEIKYCFRNNISTGYQSEWQELQEYHPNRARRTEIVSPLITSKWGQSVSNDGSDTHAYNYYVTESSNSCESCLAGCVAVAMGQIMNYWKYPVYVPHKIEQYDWCNMPNELDTISDNYEQERNAVARLLRDCGLAVGSLYCFPMGCSTGAYSEDVPDAIKQFNYGNAELKKRFWHLRTWETMLKDELNNNRPLLYSGGVHSYICDGFDSNDMFHFNWGWNGEYNNGWFTVKDINPGGNSYDNKQKAVFNIYPDINSNHCNFGLELASHYLYYYDLYGNTSPQPYDNIPQTATVLRSVPNSSSYPDSWRTIPAGTTSKYVAHETIILQDGFVAEEGSNFHAYIEPCLSCDDDVAMTSPGHNNNDRRYSNGDNHSNIILVGDNQKISTLSQSNESLHGITIYPNPTNDMFNVSFNNPEECMKQITVTNHQGSIVVNKDNPNDNVINMNNLSSGLYIVKIISDKGNVYFDKIIKN